MPSTVPAGPPRTTRRRPPRKIGGAFRFIIIVMKPILLAVSKRDWRGAENLPDAGGAVIAANHISHVDAVMFGHFIYDNGRLPRFLAKSGVFKNKFVGRILRAAGQIPVYRDTADAANAFRDALRAVADGEVVAVYPEGTITRDPAGWPMSAKTGAARIALTTGCPVIPVAQWGPNLILAYGEKKPKLFPRKTMILQAGTPVDLSDLRGRPQNTETLQIATDRIMAAITDLLAGIRGEQPPAVRFDADPAKTETATDTVDGTATGAVNGTATGAVNGTANGVATVAATPIAAESGTVPVTGTVSESHGKGTDA